MSKIKINFDDLPKFHFKIKDKKNDDVKNADVDVDVDVDFSKIDVGRLPMISQYKIIGWIGEANGTPLTPAFDLNILKGRRMVVKSMRFIPYLNPGFTNYDFVLEALAGNSYQIRQTGGGAYSSRVLNNYETFLSGLANVSINGVDVFFNNNNNYLMASDQIFDNIFYLFPAKVDTMAVRFDNSYLTDPTGIYNPDQKANYYIKIIFEVYLI